MNVYKNTVYNHFTYLKEFISLLMYARLTLNLHKCILFQHSVDYVVKFIFPVKL